MQNPFSLGPNLPPSFSLGPTFLSPPSFLFPLPAAQFCGPENLPPAQPVTTPPPLSLSLRTGPAHRGLPFPPAREGLRLKESRCHTPRRSLPWPAGQGSPTSTISSTAEPPSSSFRSCRRLALANPSRAAASSAIGARKLRAAVEPLLRRPKSPPACPRSSAAG